MPFLEKNFINLINANQLAFKDICQQLCYAHKESQSKSIPLTISANTQKVIYDNLPRILPNFFGEVTPVARVSGVNSFDISQWMIGISHFISCDVRNKLLRDTATLIEYIERKSGSPIDWYDFV